MLVYHRRFDDRRDLYRPSIRGFLEYGEQRAMTAEEYVAAQTRRAELTYAWVDWLAEHRIDAIVEPTVPISKSMQWATSFGINVLLNLVAFTVIYRFVPQPKVHWRDAMRGALVAAVLWETGRQLLAVFLIHRGYPSAYGIIGSFLAIMLWAYYAMLVVFFGAEYTRVVGDQRRDAVTKPA